MILRRSFYLEQDACEAARSLLGKVIVTRIGGSVTAGLITETEAYMGIDDRASHAYGGKRTNRNEVMYARGGVAYVYICYGIHHLFNVVVHDTEVPHAVLIRAIRPLEGMEAMLLRRPSARDSTGGPGTLTQTLGISVQHNGEELTGKLIWIEDRGFVVRDRHILTGPRIGVAYAKEDALLPYRYRIAPSHLPLP
ncbi:MAG TPA: DNA-3-methyladenine glycosylase [Flavobacteriales bacterium]|nr:DNA-3-methyladenine glycosylase [Flavobacteriales bacterium]